ncbi:MAG: TetR/AcrR family transcriptional regulator C-terminal domain-containing protein [Synergistaceae bacterium]|jgi:probable dihydroxyacetone kinase regulator|nr:TetR/AcrR family transcriptional regulator C-terminal domain-containing protein [Synergistaceae bacterium]
MSKTALMKKALVDALKALVKEKSLAKITVSDITEYCGISRNTFYYHFNDKYDLINWIFYSETLPEINAFSEPDRWFDGFVRLCRYMQANRDFYLEALDYAGQNSLQDYLVDFYFELLKIHINTIYSQSGCKLADEELFLMARMEAHSYAGIVMDWVKQGMQDDYMARFEQLRRVSMLAGSRYSIAPSDEKTAGQEPDVQNTQNTIQVSHVK